MPDIDLLFDALLSAGGSDLHLGIGYPPLMRLRGALVEMRKVPVDSNEIESLLFEIVTSDQKKTITETLDLDFAYGYGDKARFSCANYFYKTTGLAAVFRTIPSKVLTLEDLKCPPVLRKLADRRTGLVLVTGPTGSGKSTTLAAMIDHINKTRACHVLTIEDPVEFVHVPQRAQVSHREIRAHASRRTRTRSRSAGREDPNVILIGDAPDERDYEACAPARQLRGARVRDGAHEQRGGHDRPYRERVPGRRAAAQVRGMLSENACAGIVAQQLLRTPRTANAASPFARNPLSVRPAPLASMIRENKTFQIPSLMQGGQAQGMQTMDMALERIVRDGTVSAEAARWRKAITTRKALRGSSSRALKMAPL